MITTIDDFFGGATPRATNNPDVDMVGYLAVATRTLEAIDLPVPWATGFVICIYGTGAFASVSEDKSFLSFLDPRHMSDEDRTLLLTLVSDTARALMF